MKGEETTGYIQVNQDPEKDLPGKSCASCAVWLLILQVEANSIVSDRRFQIVPWVLSFLLACLSSYLLLHMPSSSTNGSYETGFHTDLGKKAKVPRWY
jgi:hypothetical protein